MHNYVWVAVDGKSKEDAVGAAESAMHELLEGERVYDYGQRVEEDGVKKAAKETIEKGLEAEAVLFLDRFNRVKPIANVTNPLTEKEVDVSDALWNARLCSELLDHIGDRRLPCAGASIYDFRSETKIPLVEHKGYIVLLDLHS
jgi:hypothetical protein